MRKLTKKENKAAIAAITNDIHECVIEMLGDEGLSIVEHNYKLSNTLHKSIKFALEYFFEDSGLSLSEE
jgi:hypothetical protein